MRRWTWVGAAVAMLWISSTAVADSALDKPAFSAAPGELLALGRAAPAGDAPAVVLRDEHTARYDDAGRAVLRWRSVSVIKADAGLEPARVVRAAWDPGHQDRPAIRARVIDPAGHAVELDPASVIDGPLVRYSALMFSERRVTEATLPRLAVGSVIEQEVVISDGEALFVAGRADVFEIGHAVPTRATRLVFDVPAGRHAHLVERELPAGVRPHHEVRGGRELWSYALGPVAASPDEDGVPGDVVRRPYVGVATAASWHAVAAAYNELLDQRIAAGPVRLPPELPHTATVEAVAAITAWMHDHVQDSGIELGAASLTPRLPADTLQRRFAGAIDEATLLIALLRQAGVRAEVAVLAAGPGRDVDPELPGMGVFDHVLVRAEVAGRALWIDPAEALQRPGELPGRAQGRRVLVIADDTQALSTTPAAAAADHLKRSVATFVVAEYGPSQLTLVTREAGPLEAVQRRWLRVAAVFERQRQAYAAYLQEVYGGSLERVTSSDPVDLGHPLELTFAVRDARQVSTDHRAIEIQLVPLTVLDRLNAEVHPSLAGPRVRDFAWATPHITELEHRIVVPEGFTLPALPPDRTVALGPATFTERRRIEGRTLIVTFRLDTGKRRISAAEWTALQHAAHVLGKEHIQIRIMHTAAALADAGKPREALAECDRLIALHPKEALHHAQRGIVLLGAGAGEAARRAARDAVALAPNDPDPWVTLGWALGRDTLGRPYRYDWDRAGAIAALQKARALSPTHVAAAAELARILERDARGDRFAPGADLAGAEAAWRAAIAGARTPGHEVVTPPEDAVALADVLISAGKLVEAEQVARAVAPGRARDQTLVTAVAGVRGAGPAIQEAAALATAAERDKLVEYAGWQMMARRRYDVGRALLTAAHANLGSAFWTTAVAHVTLQPSFAGATADPQSAVIEVLLAMIDPGRKTSVFWDAELEREVRKASKSELLDIDVQLAGDLVRSSTTTKIDGDAELWRARVDITGRPVTYYLVSDAGLAKLIGSADLPWGVGRYVLRTLDARGVDPARRLLDWLRSDTEKLSGPLWDRFRSLWGAGLPATRDAILLAAAALAGATDADRVIPIAKRCASSLAEAPRMCHELLEAAYSARERWSDAITELDEIARLDPAHAASQARWRAWVLSRAARYDDADRVLERALASAPDDHDALAGRVLVAARRGDLVEAVRRADVLANRPAAPPGDLNQAAWIRVVAETDRDGAVAFARRAVAGRRSAGTLNTLAALEAEAGDLAHAVADTRAAVSLRSGAVRASADPGPSDADWYVVGRIEEQLGLIDDAAATYRRIEPDADVLSPYRLAQRRLAALPRAPSRAPRSR